MKSSSVRNEILLLVTTAGSNREWCGNNAYGRPEPITPEAWLEEACLNGLLEELLTGIIGKTASDRELYIWHIRQGESLLQIKLCEPVVLLEERFSIDPCYFLPVLLAMN